jgi:YD repeat-containing protein
MPETMTDEFGKVEQYFYDAADNLKKTIDRQGDSVWTAYDRMNRPRTRRIGAVRIDNSTEHNSVYKDTQSDHFADTTYVGRVLVPEDTVIISYDVLGNATRIENKSAIIVRAFTKEGGVSFDSTYLKFGPNAGKALRLTYERGGMRKTLQTKLRTYTYGYDAKDGSLATIAYPTSTIPNFSWTWPAGTVSYSWDNLARLDSIDYPSGSWAKFRYDSGGRLASLLAESSTRVIADDEHTYNSADDLVDLSEYEQYADPDLVDSDFAYDGAGRDTSFRAADAGGTLESAQFRYDPNGNREWEKKYPAPTSSDSILNVLVAGSNRLARRDGYSGSSIDFQKLYSYDHNGNQIRDHWKWLGDWVAADFYYDAEGKLIVHQPTVADCSSEPIPGISPTCLAVPSPVGPNTVNAFKDPTTYFYDGLGRRVG